MPILHHFTTVQRFTAMTLSIVCISHVCPRVSACASVCQRVPACVRVCSCGFARAQVCVFECVRMCWRVPVSVRVGLRVSVNVRICSHVYVCVRVCSRVSVWANLVPFHLDNFVKFFHILLIRCANFVPFHNFFSVSPQ